MEEAPRGLTSDVAGARLREAGPNEPASVQRATLIAEVVRLFANPLIAILLIASIVSAGVGEWTNATIIVAMVVLGALLIIGYFITRLR